MIGPDAEAAIPALLTSLQKNPKDDGPVIAYTLGKIGKPAIRPLLVERDLGLPVLSESRIGAGRAFFFGANETWRWRQNVGERDQDRFWSQLIVLRSSG